MRNVLGPSVLLMLLLLLPRTLRPAAAKMPELCGSNEDVQPPNKSLPHPYCWFGKTLPHDEHMVCDCGAAYSTDLYGRCKDCAAGYGRDENNNCVHCPRGDERWCRAYGQCICLKNHQRNVGDICTPCGQNEESNGIAECDCKGGYGRNEHGACVQCGKYEIVDAETKKCDCLLGYTRNSQIGCFACFDPEDLQFNKAIGEYECSCPGDSVRNIRGVCQSTKVTNFTGKLVWIGFFCFAFLGLMSGYAIRQYVKKA